MAWWLWNAWVDDGPARRPFYGLLAQTKAAVDFSERNETALASGSKLVVAEKVLPDAICTPLKQLVEQRPRSIDLTAHWADAPIISLQLHRQIVAPAFGLSTARILCGYGLPSVENLFPAPQDIGPLIDACCTALGLPFRKEFAAHLGGFDLFDLGPSLDSPGAFRTEVLRALGSAPAIFRVWRTELYDERQVVHLLGRADGEVVIDQIRVMKAGVRRLDFALPQLIERYELRIFDHHDGEVRHTEANALIREIPLAIMTPGRTIRHNDRLSNLAQAHTPAKRQRAQSSAALNTTRSVIGDTRDVLRAHVRTVGTLLDSELGEHSGDMWFPRTFDAQLDVIDHFNHLLRGSEVREAILVDPFFGEEALRRLALRLSDQSVRLTVVASWGRTHPDTGLAVADDASTALEEANRRLADVFAQIGPHVAPRMRFLNVVTKSPEQAFHDRYLALYPHDASPRVFLLSNSVNNLAANWPFCMSLLTGPARLEAGRYIEGLTRGDDITGSTVPHISFEWPTPASGTSAT